MTMKLERSDYVFALSWAAKETNFKSVPPRKDGKPNWNVPHRLMDAKYQWALDAIAHRDETPPPKPVRSKEKATR